MTAPNLPPGFTPLEPDRIEAAADVQPPANLTEPATSPPAEPPPAAPERPLSAVVPPLGDDLTALVSAVQGPAESDDPAISEAVADDAATESDVDTSAEAEPIAERENATSAETPVVWIPLGDPPAEAPPATSDEQGWYRHESGRWVVGDPGRQLDIPAKASRIVQTRSDLSVDWAEYGALEYRAASIRGLGHFADGKPRQDACGIAFAPNNRWLVGCVADGVSAAAHAHQAADIAAATFTLKIGNDLADTETISDADGWPSVAAAIGWQAATDEVTKEINTAAEARFRRGYERSGDHESLARLDAEGLPNHDARQVMATTAVVFAVATEPLPDRRVPFAVVIAAGDSEAMILSQGSWHPISAVKNAGAEVASSAVSPLPRTTEVTPIVGFLEPGQALAVFTDGIGDPLGSGTGVVGRFLAQRWASVADPIAFANDIAFYRKSFVDDRTAVLVWVKD